MEPTRGRMDRAWRGTQATRQVAGPVGRSWEGQGAEVFYRFAPQAASRRIFAAGSLERKVLRALHTHHPFSTLQVTPKSLQVCVDLNYGTPDKIFCSQNTGSATQSPCPHLCLLFFLLPLLTPTSHLILATQLYSSIIYKYLLSFPFLGMSICSQ